ncbi:MAG: alanine--tRNA ligase [Nanoarchaeota archaeon]|nr:alanine--tRNA ligase [Nanoarchaeota archaeon]MBU1644175.1 alanine--tRNA ligase [Nanoarchaeota archaeon]MBU1977520.1 alanine--tRNA ligase [Nanoarchaeota archaeon]
MKAKELKKRYLDFFRKKGHIIVPSAPLIPKNDSTVLFTNAGMHPLVEFLAGQPHPEGKRLASVQKCMRTQDIEEVGDNRHITFFEMLGNWSLGDYFKKEAIEWSFEFLTKELKLPLDRLAVTCFKGDKDAPKDDESAEIWIKLGVPKERIAFLGKKDNWWGPVGETGPCGPDTEMFYWVSDAKAPKKFDPQDENWVEIWNDVFMQYNKQKDGTFRSLKQKNVDTGLGVERVAMILQKKKTVFDTELFQPIFKKLNSLATEKLNDENIFSYRVMADHLRAAVFIMGDERGVAPSNVDQGYILRRYIRRTIRHGKKVGMPAGFCEPVVDIIFGMYKEDYPILDEKKDFIISELRNEEEKFERTLEKGLKEFEKMAKEGDVSGVDAFLLFQSYGFPLEMTEEMADENNISVDVEGFLEEFKKHQELSRLGAEKKFKGGLADLSPETTKLHTATHLLNEALRKVVSPNIKQKGSNITPERLRFDFNFDRKLTSEEIKKVEDEVNRLIKSAIPVERKEMTKKEAEKLGAQMEFGQKYPEKVSVYFIGEYSKEFCGGPHVENTKDLGKFHIQKEESSAAGVRRIKAVLKDEPRS